MDRVKGIAMIISGAIFWGATGPLMQWSLSTFGFSPEFLSTVRLIFAGLLLLGFLKLKGVHVTSIFKGKIWVRPLLIFAVFGMLGAQYTFVSAIDASDAVVATLLQFLAPVYIILFVSLRQKKFPPAYQITGMAGTLLGLFLLLTNGSLDKLAISGEALFWGILVGLTFMFYTLYPARLMQEWGVMLVVGWSMLFGGAFMGLVKPVFLSSEWTKFQDVRAIWAMLAIIVIGTVAFVLFLSSMRFISPVETSILSSVEPLTAMVISVFWFQQLLAPPQLSGALIMLVFVTWLSLAGNIKLKKKKAGYSESSSS
ncbi:EamA-like transporter family protein [Planococcus glaciei]|uniref:DMT family transporter n=1 Tax=Planococcus glaciei TaxID=459472 RepID=UPI00088ECCE9|nr:DMT family transporter [Planococcus glaciei]SDG62775.1 EamA-like transporter family protein [Planococcus glaciei]